MYYSVLRENCSVEGAVDRGRCSHERYPYRFKSVINSYHMHYSRHIYYIQYVNYNISFISETSNATYITDLSAGDAPFGGGCYGAGSTIRYVRARVDPWTTTRS
jgi:hypothetical protein